MVRGGRVVKLVWEMLYPLVERCLNMVLLSNLGSYENRRSLEVDEYNMLFIKLITTTKKIIFILGLSSCILVKPSCLRFFRYNNTIRSSF